VQVFNLHKCHPGAGDPQVENLRPLSGHGRVQTGGHWRGTQG